MTNQYSAMRVYSLRSERLYLNPAERQAFRKMAEGEGDKARLLCLLLFHTGCRLSEALNLRWADIQWNEGIVAIRSLKKRTQHHMREVPVPPDFMQFAKACHRRHRAIKPFFHDRTTGWRRVGEVMVKANISGVHATPKGLRHSFAMWCAYQSIPITLCQKWMGHASIQTTAVYYQCVGKEEREMAKKLW